MADQKKWFKVWTSILSNGNFAEMSLEDIGRWTLLGAAIALDGDSGSLLVPGEGKELCRILRVENLDEAKRAIERITSAVWEQSFPQGRGKLSTGQKSFPQDRGELSTGPEGHKMYGTKSVRFRNWYTYQEDSRRLEGTIRTPQRRGEERRSEETTPLPPPLKEKRPMNKIQEIEKKLDEETDPDERDRLARALEKARGSGAIPGPTIGALERRIKVLTEQLDGEADETRRDRLTAKLKEARNELITEQKGGVQWGKPRPGRR